MSTFGERDYGEVRGGKVVEYSLANHSIQLKVLSYGATVSSLKVRDASGAWREVVLGFDSLEGYLAEENRYLGAIIGRTCDRIAEGKFSLEGADYQLDLNDVVGPGCCLHGGKRGWDKCLWKGRLDKNTTSLTLSLISPDGDQGFPGDVLVSVTYTLGEATLDLKITAMTTKTTVLNVTNHTYFNLGDNDTIVDHWVELPSKRTTEVDEALIPTGRVVTVEGTPLDLTKPTRLGEVLDRCPGGDYAGFSHTYVIEANVTEENNGKMTEKVLKENNLALCGTVEERTSGLGVRVLTSQPGVIFYTGQYNSSGGKPLIGRGGRTYGKYSGLCLETQRFGDSPHHPNFPTWQLKPGEVYKQDTSYQFFTL